MANIAKSPVVTGKLYRHFAAITIGITLIIALMADGEAQEAIGAEVAVQTQQKALKEAEIRKLGARKLGDRRQNTGGGGGREITESYFAENALGGESSYMPEGLMLGSDIGDYEPSGPAPVSSPVRTTETAPFIPATPDELAAMNARQRQAYFEKLRKMREAERARFQSRSSGGNGGAPDIAALRAASRARSVSYGDTE